MKREELKHPRIFNDSSWANGYYERNKIQIQKTGQRIAKILKYSGFYKGDILDAGCGFAGVPIELAKSFPNAHIQGVDLSLPLLEIGKRNITGEYLKHQISLSEADVQNMHMFPDNSFDCVVSSFMLHIVKNPQQMLAELERVCKPNGIIIITDLRRGFLARFNSKLRKSFNHEEFKSCINLSEIRKGLYKKGPFWSDYISK